MKIKNTNMLLFGLGLMILFLESCTSLNSLPFDKVRSLKITYSTSFKIATDLLAGESAGIKVLYIDLVKKRMREETITATPMGLMEANLKQIRFSDGEKMYMPTGNINEVAYYELDNNKPSPWESEIEDDKYLIGREKIAGEDCAIYAHNTGDIYRKIWIWNNIVLKITQKNEKIISSEEAISIEKNIKLNDSLFMPPEGYTVISRDEFLKRFNLKKK